MTAAHIHMPEKKKKPTLRWAVRVSKAGESFTFHVYAPDSTRASMVALRGSFRHPRTGETHSISEWTMTAPHGNVTVEEDVQELKAKLITDRY